MKLLLDTHIAIWWQYQPGRISPEVLSLVRDQAEEVRVSRASLWEVAIKIGLGKLRLSLARFMAQLHEDRFAMLAIEDEHILQVASLENYPDHRDPFDRLLVAQSIAEPLTLLTADSRLARYGSTVRVVS